MTDEDIKQALRTAQWEAQRRGRFEAEDALQAVKPFVDALRAEATRVRELVEQNLISQAQSLWRAGDIHASDAITGALAELRSRLRGRLT